MSAINGSGRAAAAVTMERIHEDGLFDAQNHRIADARHGHNVTVPGAVAGWFDLHALHG